MSKEPVKKKPAKKPVKKPVKKAKKKPAKKSEPKPRKSRAISTAKKVVKKHAKKSAIKLPDFMTNKTGLNHYRFALKYIELELNATQAYLAVYGDSYALDTGKQMTGHVAQGSASKLLCNPIVQSHVKELVKEWMDKDKANAFKILSRYNRWADSNIADIMDWEMDKGFDDDGREYNFVRPTVTKLSELPLEVQRNIKSVSFTKDGFKIDLVDKKASNDQLAKLIGLDKTDKGTGDVHIHFDKSDENL